MEDIAGWGALAATSVAALMTASNLGPRVTGWGFVIFAIGAIAWIVVGVATGQRTLLISNAFLLLVDIVGVWRWLGRRAKFGDAARAGEARSARADRQTLFAASGIDGMAVTDRDGTTTAHAVDMLSGCGDGRIDHVIIRTGGTAGVGEDLRLLPWGMTRMCDTGIATDLAAADFAGLTRAEAR